MTQGLLTETHVKQLMVYGQIFLDQGNYKRALDCCLFLEEDVDFKLSLLRKQLSRVGTKDSKLTTNLYEEMRGLTSRAQGLEGNRIFLMRKLNPSYTPQINNRRIN